MSSNLQNHTRQLQLQAITFVVAFVQLAVLPATCSLHVCGDAAVVDRDSEISRSACCCGCHAGACHTQDASQTDDEDQSDSGEPGHPSNAPHCCRVCQTAFALVTVHAAADWVPRVDGVQPVPVIFVQAAESPVVFTCSGRGPPV